MQRVVPSFDISFLTCAFTRGRCAAVGTSLLGGHLLLLRLLRLLLLLRLLRHRIGHLWLRWHLLLLLCLLLLLGRRSQAKPSWAIRQRLLNRRQCRITRGQPIVAVAIRTLTIQRAR